MLISNILRPAPRKSFRQKRSTISIIIPIGLSIFCGQYLGCEPPNAGISVTIYKGMCTADGACDVQSVNNQVAQSNNFSLGVTVSRNGETFYDSDIPITQLQTTGGPQLGLLIPPDKYGTITVKASLRNRIGCDVEVGETTQVVSGGRAVFGIQLLPVQRPKVSNHLYAISSYKETVNGKEVQRFLVGGAVGFAADMDQCKIINQYSVANLDITAVAALNAKTRWLAAPLKIYRNDQPGTAASNWVEDSSYGSRGHLPIAITANASQAWFTHTNPSSAAMVSMRADTDTSKSLLWNSEQPIGIKTNQLIAYTGLSTVVSSDSELAVGLEYSDPMTGAKSSYLAYQLAPGSWKQVAGFKFNGGSMNTSWGGPGPRYLFGGNQQAVVELRGSVKAAAPVVTPYRLPNPAFLAGWSITSVSGISPSAGAVPPNDGTDIWAIATNSGGSFTEYRLVHKTPEAQEFVDVSNLVPDINKIAPTQVSAIAANRVFIIGENGWRAVLDGKDLFPQQ